MMITWKGRGGIISKIIVYIGYSRTSNINIEKVLVNIVLCKIDGSKFDWPKLDSRTVNHAPTYNINSIEANIITQNIERGLFERNTLSILN